MPRHEASPEHALGTVTGVVEHGDHRGRALGFPTANLYLPEENQLPPDGVYGGLVRLVGKPSRLLGVAAISVGTNPTFGELRRRLEAHILDFDGDIYGEVLEVQICFFVRSMMTFASVDELLAAIHADVQACRRRAPEFAWASSGQQHRVVTRPLDE